MLVHSSSSWVKLFNYWKSTRAAWASLLNAYKYRLFYRLSLFSHKIINTHLLLNNLDLLKHIVKTYSTREKNTNSFEIPLILSNSEAKRFSIVLSMMVNKVLEILLEILSCPSDKVECGRTLSFFCCFWWEDYEYHGGSLQNA